jgi:hypothetical protein
MQAVRKYAYSLFGVLKGAIIDMQLRFILEFLTPKFIPMTFAFVLLSSVFLLVIYLLLSMITEEETATPSSVRG